MRTPYAAILRTLSVLLLMAATVAVAADDSASDSTDVALPSDVDVRFLVDISGSMKRTDPDNLRRSAVAMVAELMPEGASGGLWTFARYVNMLAPLGEVDDEWRREVRDAVPEIDSPGQYTNIGVALDTVTQDFWPGGGYEDTHVVLLTDGMVDVPGGEAASQSERDRILDEVVGHFQKHGATLHTMALSDEADHALLERLAVETGGQYTVAESDSDLTRAFLSAFDAASPTEEVPLEDNGFSIDDSVEEFTALIFREDGSGGAELVSPDDERYSRGDLPGDARWHATDDYDLVTIPDPATGRWGVDAIIGPDSRIKVVSELRMSVNDLPAHFFASDSLPVKVAFFEEGERLTDKDFLGLIDLRLEIHDDEGGRRGTRQLSGDGIPANGIFKDSISTLGEPGRYEVRIIADGETFKRSERQTIELRPPFDTEVQARGTGDGSEYRFRVLGRDPGIEQETVSIQARVTRPDGEVGRNALNPTGEGAVWEWVLDGDRPDGVYRVALNVQAETQDGRLIDLAFPPFEARLPRESESGDYSALSPREPEPEPAPEPEPETEPEPEATPEPKFDPEPVTRPEPEPQTEDSGDGVAWWLWGIGAGALTLLLGGGAGFWFWRRHRREGEAETSPEPEAVAETVPEPEPEPEPEPAASTPDDGESLAEAAAAYQAQQAADEDHQDEESPEAAPEEEPELEADLDTGAGADEEPGEEPVEGAEDEAGGAEDVSGEAEDEAADEAIPTLDSGDAAEAPGEEPEPEPEPEPEASSEPESEPESEPDAEALADQILDENQAEESDDEDEFSLEDFDISEFDDLPEQDESDSESRKQNDKDDKG